MNWITSIAFFVFVAAAVCVYARDPFASVLPKVQRVVDATTGEAFEQAVAQGQSTQQVAPLTFKVQGVFWDTVNPRVIIDGDVYKAQDIIKGTDNARIVQIKKNSIVVLYAGSMIVKKPEQNI